MFKLSSNTQKNDDQIETSGISKPNTTRNSGYFKQVKKMSMFLNPSLNTKSIEESIKAHSELIDKKISIGMGIIKNDMDKQSESLQMKLRERKNLKQKKLHCFKKNRSSIEKLGNSTSKSSKKHRRNLSNFSLSKKFVEEDNLIERAYDSGLESGRKSGDNSNLYVISPIAKKQNKNSSSLPSISNELNKIISTFKGVVLDELDTKLNSTVKELESENLTKIEKFKESTETQIDFEIMIKTSGKFYNNFAINR